MSLPKIAITSSLIACLAIAQPPSRPKAAKNNDLSGVWAPVAQSGRMDGGADILAFSRDLPLMTPSAKSRYDLIRKGTAGPFERARDEWDPHIHCLPYGIPRDFAVNQPFQLVQASGLILMLFDSDTGVRRIYVDGREHPKDVMPTYMGYSVGRWEGRTLVVDTVGLNELTWLDSIGHLHSDDLHITERIRRIDQRTLEIAFTFDDPTTYVSPWGGTKRFELKPEWEISEQLPCEDHLREHHIPKLLRGEPE